MNSTESCSSLVSDDAPRWYSRSMIGCKHALPRLPKHGEIRNLALFVCHKNTVTVWQMFTDPSLDFTRAARETLEAPKQRWRKAESPGSLSRARRRHVREPRQLRRPSHRQSSEPLPVGARCPAHRWHAFAHPLAQHACAAREPIGLQARSSSLCTHHEPACARHRSRFS